LLKISVITPNYNYAKYIGQTIESVVSQDYDNIEHIIVDDGSTDNSIEIIMSFKEKYPDKIKLIKQENMGQTIAINVGLKAATGDIICWINSDDYYNKNVFSMIIDCFNRDTSIDAVFGDIGIVDEENKIIRINKYLKFDYASGVFNGFGKIISSNAIFWKKKLTQQVGHLNENFIYAMDSEYWSRLLLKRNVKKIKLVVANFRWHPLAKTIKSHFKLSEDYIKATAEDNEIVRKSYSNLKISTIIPYKYSILLYIPYRLKRLILRGLMGEYFN
jgi:glycosyltransferase involved in cell wall biosynthesis